MESCLIITSSVSHKEALKNIISPFVSLIESVETSSLARQKIIEKTFDLTIIDGALKDEFGVTLAIDLISRMEGQVIYLAREDVFDEISFKLEDYGIFTIKKPVNKEVFISVLKLANAAFNKLCFYKKDSENLKDKIEEIKLINKAKYILIEKLKFTEETAHRYIEKEAMNKRKKRKEIALMIIEKNKFNK